MSLRTAEHLAHSTVRIECDLSGGLSTGTGFFYGLNRQAGQHVPVIITNKHVVDGAVIGRFILTLQNSSGEPDIGATYGFELNNFQSFWHPHPDTSVDLCAMPIAPLINVAEQQGKKFFYIEFDKSLIPTTAEIDEMVGMESITMVGYPNGLWDSVNNLPIFRRGVLASDYKRDWNGKKEFLIDAACFPGSSGSPVILFDIGGYQTKKGTFLGPSRIKLLGILYAGPQYTVEGDIRIVMVPTKQKVVSVAGIPNNLGIIIKSERLLDFEGLFK
jgi:hypothetical protein